ncbi:MAG: hypothetical protein J5611_03570 [Alphaproteobacteria bacterium]|nr:hypothetical protein [Alphaproteobacteria bacterium]
MSKQKPSTSIKKPRFVLTDEHRFYLATKEISTENPDGLFFIASLFLSNGKGASGTLHTEIATFDDADSAVIYRETVAAMAVVNAETALGTMFQERVSKFMSQSK